MVDPTLPLPGLSPVAGKPVIGCFAGGRLSSDGGLPVLREVERRLQVAERLATCIEAPRDPERTVHPLADIIGFRMLAIAAGYEDGNDADSLRSDPLFKMAFLPSEHTVHGGQQLHLFRRSRRQRTRHGFDRLSIPATAFQSRHARA